MSGLDKAELCGFLFVYIFVSICHCVKEPHNRHRRRCTQGNQLNSVQKSSSVSQVNKLHTSEKCTTFLSRIITLGIIKVVFLKCALGGAANLRVISTSPGLLCVRDGIQLLVLSMGKLDTTERRLVRGNHPSGIDIA